MRALSKLRDGLVGAWCPSVSGWGGTVLRDLSGYGNHGTLTNMDPATDWVVSEGKQALDFDGSDDYVVTQVKQDIFQSLGFTISCWARFPVVVDINRFFFAFGNTANSSPICGFFTSPSTNRMAAQIRNNTGGGATILTSVPEINTNKFIHFAFSVSSPRCELFVDSESSAFSAGPSLPATFNVIAFGALVRNVIGQYANVVMDDMRFYNRALSPKEIRLLASERGIGLRPERTRRLVQGQTFTAARLRRQSLIGSGVY